MRVRIDNNGYFLGIYTDEFLSLNYESLGVENWILTDILPTTFLLKGQLVEGVWIETATENELNEYYGTV